jgi:TolB-like protein
MGSTDTNLDSRTGDHPNKEITLRPFNHHRPILPMIAALVCALALFPTGAHSGLEDFLNSLSGQATDPLLNQTKALDVPPIEVENRLQEIHAFIAEKGRLNDTTRPILPRLPRSLPAEHVLFSTSLERTALGQPVVNGVDSAHLVDGDVQSIAPAQPQTAEASTASTPAAASQAAASESEAPVKLFVKAIPDEARIRILNIKPVYEHGISLLPGPYHIEITHPGYETVRRWIRVRPGDDYFLAISLSKGDPEQTEETTTATSSALVNMPPKPSIPKNERLKIAVMEFQALNNKTGSNNLGSMIAEMFTTEVVNSESFRIVEREHLKKVLKELEVGQSGIIDTTEAQEIGKMLGADAIITGSVMKIQENLRVDSRIIEVKTGLIVSAESRMCRENLNELSQAIKHMTNGLAATFYKRK